MTDRVQLKFRRINGRFAITRLPANAPLPPWALASEDFVSITRTADELSIVCPAESVPADLRSQLYWTCLKIEGPFAFSQVGILASFLDPLAVAGIPIFAVSTYDTDYVLVQEADADRAIETLKKAGHTLIAL